jgi:hypothetical protein
MAFDLDKLKQQIYNRVDVLLTQSVYTNQAPETATYPFAVIKFDVGGSSLHIWQDVYFVGIELWTNESSTTTLNNMATALRTGLNAYYSSDSALYWRAYMESVFTNIESGKPDLTRIVGTFMVKVF